MQQGATMLYTLEEAAAVIRVSEWTLRDFIRKGKIPTVNLGARTRRIDSTELQNFINRSSSTPAPATR